MTAEQFMSFRRFMAERMGVDRKFLPERQTAAMMGVSRGLIRSWSRKGTPLHVGYACRAISNGLTPWGHVPQPKEKAA